MFPSLDETRGFLKLYIEVDSFSVHNPTFAFMLCKYRYLYLDNELYNGTLLLSSFPAAPLKYEENKVNVQNACEPLVFLHLVNLEDPLLNLLLGKYRL